MTTFASPLSLADALDNVRADRALAAAIDAIDHLALVSMPVAPHDGVFASVAQYRVWRESQVLLAAVAEVRRQRAR